MEKLKKYRVRRDFSKTSEPPPTSKTRKTKKKLFVVQKHAARSLHYDFRLEMDGVLASWAVPKGFPEEAGEKRLAIRTEDHPYAYARFEGIIPAGQYGAGTVEIWDSGTYELTKHEPGTIEVALSGKKLHGSFALIKMKSKKDQWLLLKMQE